MVPIIEHPDVQRMLLWMKSNVEAMRMLAYYVSKCVDLSNVEKDEEARKANAIVDLLRPVVKAGLSEMSWYVTAEAIQVFGGYGFISDYKVEQYARDTKIFSIYEGTNGIQSLDLVFRKILLDENQYSYKVLKENILATIEKSKGIVDDKYISQVEKGLLKLDEVLAQFNQHLSSFKFLLIGINTVPFLQSMYMLVTAWLHLWSLIITTPKMKELVGDAKGQDRQKILDSNHDAAYYSGRVLSSQFYLGAEFPKFFGKVECILSGESAVVKASSAIFTGALEE